MCGSLLSLIRTETNSGSLKQAIIQTWIHKEFELLPNLKCRNSPHVVAELFTALTLFLNPRLRVYSR